MHGTCFNPQKPAKWQLLILTKFGPTAAGASSGDGQRGASTAESLAASEEADRALAAEKKTWTENDARMPALLAIAERSAAVE